MAKDKYQNDKDLEKFQDLSGVSLRQMNTGLWLAENRRLLTKILTFVLILIAAVLFIYSTYSYIIYFMSEPIDNQVESLVTSPRNLIEPMEIGGVQGFKSGDFYDFAISLENKNSNFKAEFDYCLYQKEEAIHCESSYRLPLENNYLVVLGKDLENATDITFKIEDIFWSRINRREIPEWQSFYNERINFEFTDVKFFNASRSGLSEKVKLNTLEFTIFNDSPYSYYQIDFDILLYNNSSLVAVQRYLGESIKTEEKRPVKISWPADINSVNQVKIVPRVNITKDSVYLKYQDIVF